MKLNDRHDKCRCLIYLCSQRRLVCGVIQFFFFRLWEFGEIDLNFWRVRKFSEDFLPALLWGDVMHSFIGFVSFKWNFVVNINFNPHTKRRLQSIESQHKITMNDDDCALRWIPVVVPFVICFVLISFSLRVSTSSTSLKSNNGNKFHVVLNQTSFLEFSVCSTPTHRCRTRCLF